MAWSFSNDKPIFQQIVDKITLDIINGKYQSGERIETVRELAVAAGVNPNTMQRALAEIENSGLIYTKRGDGRYIGEDTAVIDAVRENYVRERVELFIESLKALGLADGDILKAVDNGLQNPETH